MPEWHSKAILNLIRVLNRTVKTAISKPKLSAGVTLYGLLIIIQTQVNNHPLGSLTFNRQIKLTENIEWLGKTMG